MSVKIFFDLDGVLRDLSKGMGFEPQTWNEKHPETGQTVMEILNGDLTILRDAPPMSYLSRILEMSELRKIKIATVQDLPWRPYTEEWIRKYIPNAEIIWFVNGEDKLEFCTGECKGILVEDSPNLSDYTNVILIDHPYNRNIPFKSWGKVHVRVHNPDQLIKELWKWL
jgi:hypothetical protein